MEKRDPLASRTNVAAVKPMQYSKLPGPSAKGLSRLPRPGSQSAPVPTPSSQEAQPQQQKRKASPDRENVQQTSASKRTKLDNGPSSKPVATKPVKPSTRNGTSRPLATAVRPSSTSGRAAPGTKPQARTAPSRTAQAKPRPNTGKATTSKPGPGRPTAGTANTSTESAASDTTPDIPGLSKPPPAKKRAAWDMKGRLLDMEALMRHQDSQNATLQALMTDNLERIRQLEGQKQRLEVQTQDTTQEVDDLQRKLRQSEETLYTETRSLRRTIEDLEFSKSSLTRQLEALQGELSAATAENGGLKTSLAQMASSQEAVKAELTVNQLNLEQALEDGRLKASQIAELRATVASQQATIAEQQGQLREEETTRRRLHNTIQELKGNIRVFCRVRPLLGAEREGNDGEIQHLNFPTEKTLELEKLGDVGPNETLGSRNQANKYDFTFDRVFTPQSSQAEVFDEISQLVQSSLDGYNVCIFAYGQTGSGKTFTMEGPETVTPDTEGMIPRAVTQVFTTAAGLGDKGWQYKFEASFLEIYNETIRDLLTRHGDDVKHEVRMVEANSNDTYVTNLTTRTVIEQAQVSELLSQASENRAVAETKCNERSSRSHSVFRLKIEGHNTHTDEQCTGLLNLIDLAGSERLKDSGSQGARLKETQSINKSLSNLGNVIMALANKDSHIPYRNSKLTHVLQNSLGGNSKTLMFVNVSPKDECFSETLNSLRFATKVNNCSIGTATKKVK